MKNICIILLLLISTTVFPKETKESGPMLDLALFSFTGGMKFVVLDKADQDLTDVLPFFYDLIWDFKIFYGSNFKRQINVYWSASSKYNRFKLKDGDKYISNIAVIRKFLKYEYEMAPEGVEKLDAVLEAYYKTSRVDALLVEKMNLWVCLNLRYNIKKCD